jgi:hypothetical protein
MGNLIVSTQMTLDGVIDVGEWYVAEGEHDRAGRGPARSRERGAPRARDVRGSRRLLVTVAGRLSQPDQP